MNGSRLEDAITGPDQAQALYAEGNRCLAAGDAAGAEECFLRALALEPAHAGGRANLGYLKESAGALDEAESHYRQALALMPDHAQLYLNLGALLLKRRQFEQAEVILRLAAEMAPTLPVAWNQLGMLLACVQREQEAEQCYRHALTLDPAHARTRFNLSYILLRQGRLREGWPLLDARWEFEQLPQFFDCPRWQGESLQGKALAIGVEAGQGDMIQFCRYTALLKARGAARIGVVCHPALQQLFTSLPGVDQVFRFDQPVPPGGWDYWTLPMSLPGLLDTRLDIIPAPIPYLAADPAQAAHWRAVLQAADPGTAAAPLRVGLAWKGNPDFENDADRSLPSLAVLAPLARLSHAAGATAAVQFISLQKGPGQHEADEQAAAGADGLRPLPLGAQLRDFADTAALIVNLDLVISVDSAVAHLAGALGKPCWLLLPHYRCDWRWLTQRDDTPWYPGSTRLFRQAAAGDWAPVIEAVAAALTAMRQAI